MSSPFNKSERPIKASSERPERATGSRAELCAVPIIKGLIGGRGREKTKVNKK